MKSFLIALNLVEIVSKCNYSIRGYRMSDIRNSCEKLWKMYGWWIENGFDFDILRDLENTKKQVKTLEREKKSFFNEYAKVKDKIDSIRLEHEEEIIRLKDIIQAKQVQIDKLLEGKNEV